MPMQMRREPTLRGGLYDGQTFFFLYPKKKKMASLTRRRKVFCVCTGPCYQQSTKL